MQGTIRQRQTATGCNRVYRYPGQERKLEETAFGSGTHPMEADGWKSAGCLCHDLKAGADYSRFESINPQRRLEDKARIADPIGATKVRAVRSSVAIPTQGTSQMPEMKCPR